MSIVNMLFMHYYIYWNCGLEIDLYNTSGIDNLLFCLLDTTLIFTMSLALTLKSIKGSLLLTFFTTFIISFSNVFYARFFGQYLSFSSIGQIGNLSDSTVIDSMLAGFEYLDLYYPLILCLFILLLQYANKGKHHLKNNCFRTLTIVIIAIGLLFSIVNGHYFLSHSFHVSKNMLKKTVLLPPDYNILLPNWAAFNKGLFRTFIIDNYKNLKRNSSLSDEQIQRIEDEYKNHSQRVTCQTTRKEIDNLIFIIVESYLSVTSDLTVNGKEITPFLNNLKRDSNVYYNSHMLSNVSLGESSDGQFIYMTGVLPLHSEITVSIAKDCTFMGLPKLLKETGLCDSSQIIVPTPPSIWEQRAMNLVYGIDKTFSRNDYYLAHETVEDLSDEQLFSLARKTDNAANPSFFSLILTLSMHQPYDEPIDNKFVIEDKNYSQKYINYLNACHFFDHQIEQYINNLKRLHLFENSLIVITSDHEAHLKQLNMEGKLPTHLPLYIINGGIDKSQAWSGICNQLDVYTTILDVLGIKSEWRGLGHTLLNPDYVNSVTPETKRISEEIIYGNYFKDRVIHFEREQLK